MDYSFSSSSGSNSPRSHNADSSQLLSNKGINVVEAAPNSTSAPLSVLDSSINANKDIQATECDTFLLSSAIEGRVSRSFNTSATVHQFRMRGSCWARAHSFVVLNWYLGLLLPVSIIGGLLLVGWLTRDYARQLLLWIEEQNSWIMFTVFMGLFTVVSFPVVVGYFVLLITAGYLFSCLRGLLTVTLGANLGVAIAHATIRSCRHRIPVHRLIKNDTGRAILRVISGQKAFRVVLLTRLTPIPFGLQNVIFGVSSINSKDYHLASLIGLLPAQAINVYLGSTLRSMHEVLNDNHTRVTGYLSFAFEVVCGVVLMLWVVQKARKELSESLLSADYDNEGKHPELQV